MAAHTIREALGAVAARDVVVQVLHRALHRSGAVEIPPGGAELRAFVSGPLAAAVQFVLGEDVGEMVLMQLSPIVARIPTREPIQPLPKNSLPSNRLPRNPFAQQPVAQPPPAFAGGVGADTRQRHRPHARIAFPRRRAAAAFGRQPGPPRSAVLVRASSRAGP